MWVQAVLHIGMGNDPCITGMCWVHGVLCAAIQQPFCFCLQCYEHIFALRLYNNDSGIFQTTENEALLDFGLKIYGTAV